MMQDPMVNEKEAKEEKLSKVTTAAKGKKIQPDSATPGIPEPKKVTEPDQETAEVSASSPELSETKPEPTEGQAATEDTKVPDDNAEQSSPEAVVDAVASQTATDKKKADELTKADQEKQAHLEELVNDKTYAVPIGVFHKSGLSWKRLLLVVTALILLGAASYVYISLN